MSNIFLGEPPANIKAWIVEHYSPAPAGHADTWYKYPGDTEWRTVSISGTINSGGFDEEIGEDSPTKQIPNVASVVALEIGTDVTSINFHAFKNCIGLESVTIPDSVTSIGAEAFRDCSGLTSVTIGNGMTSIESYAFFNCSGLTSVTIGNGITSIGESAFEDCFGLTSVTFLGKTLAQVEAMSNYSWGISDTSVINVA